MGKYTKNIIIYIILALIFITGCSNSKTNIEGPSVQEIWGKIEKAADVEEMRKGDDDDLKDLYGIDAADVEEYVLYTAPSNIEADEILIIRAKDAKDIEGIEKNITKRVEDIGDSFKDYIPEEYHLVEKHIVNSKQNYVIFVISEEVDKIEGVFKESFK